MEYTNETMYETYGGGTPLDFSNYLYSGDLTTFYICPKCHKRHLVESNKILTTYPPQYMWYCPDEDGCGYVFTGFDANSDWDVDSSVVLSKEKDNNDAEIEKLKEKCQDLEKEVKGLKKEIYMLRNPEMYEMKVPSVRDGGNDEWGKKVIIVH